jgi:hypothetical protein
VADVDVLAEPRSCVRCAQLSLIGILGRCADCISDTGLRHPEEYAAWKVEVTESIGRK